MNVLIHQLWDFSRLIGLRDRLRCPACDAIGTWKPHGGWLDFKDERKVRRWLCKWCGWYVGPEGYKQCMTDGKSAWQIAEPFSRWGVDGITPQLATRILYEDRYGAQYPHPNPWAG